MALQLESFVNQISLCETTEQLRELRDKWYNEPLVAPTEQSILDVMHITNEIHDCFIKKAIFLAEQVLLTKGMASPSVKYAFLLVGSGGRREQTPWSDQDNALVYEDGESVEAQKHATYFQALGCEIANQLMGIGYPPCEGNVGANNSNWCKPISDWMNTLNEWFAEPNWENIRYLLITADLRCVYGDEALVDRIQSHLISYADTHTNILNAMLNNTLRHKIVLNVFGRLLVEPYGEHAGCVDVKYGGYIPIINSIRLCALLAGVKETSSMSRITALYEAGYIDSTSKQKWTTALSTILSLRYQTNYELKNNQYSTAGMIAIKAMDREMKLKLKTALKTGRELQRFVQKRIYKLGG